MSDPEGAARRMQEYINRLIEHVKSLRRSGYEEEETE